MTRLCDKAGLFVDGELPFEEAEAFRLHLPDCVRCQTELANLMQLKLLGHRYIQHTAEPEQAEVSRLVSRVRWKPPVLVAVSALAAAMVVAVALRPLSSPELRHDVWLVERPERPLEPRLSYLGADRYRPVASTMMGGDGAAEELPLEDMAVLQKEDEHGLAAAYLVHDEPEKAERVLKKLRERGRAPELDSDLAVAMLRQGKSKEALQLLDEVLAEHPRHPQALWNRALVLRELGLSLLAAEAFSEIAAMKEPGWSGEAAQKAEALRSATSGRYERWKAVFEAGRALLDAAPGTLPEGFDQLSGSRRRFYDAVRSAPSRERVLALLPIAQLLDARAGGNVLEGYVRRVAEADFARRAPLARDYAALAWRRLQPPEQERLFAALLKSKEDDLLLGVLLSMSATPHRQALIEEKAAASGDPWFQLLARLKRAEAELAAGRVEHAVELLHEASGSCPAPGLEFLCISVDIDLSTYYVKLQRSDDARRHAELGLEGSRKGNEWSSESSALWNLAQVARFGNDTPLLRAYLGEYLAHQRGDADAARRVHQDLAVMAVEELRMDEARREIDAALATGLPLALSGAFALADIARLRAAPGDEEHLSRALEKIRPGLSPGERAVATHVLGRFFIERDVERGRSLLLSAIKEASAPGLEEDPGARRARAYSFNSLLHEAGQREAFQEALELFERERGKELPRRCLLAATVDTERTLLLVLGAAGELIGHYDGKRDQALPQRLDGLVPEKLLLPLRECEQVEVLARPPLHGRAGLLPPQLAWSYLTSRSERRSPPAGPAVHLVVSGVKLPSEVSLKRLNDWTPAFGPDERRVVLSGDVATPSQVLRAMRDATEIDLVTHGIINGYADTSFLLLASEQEDSKLGVSRVRTASLQGAPFVVLAACYAAHATYSVADPFSLPAAFIEAGARGVLAATVEIPDREAEAFFNAIREHLRSRKSPKLALRDERMRWLEAGRGETWLGSVLLFE